MGDVPRGDSQRAIISRAGGHMQRHIRRQQLFFAIRIAHIMLVGCAAYLFAFYGGSLVVAGPAPPLLSASGYPNYGRQLSHHSVVLESQVEDPGQLPWQQAMIPAGHGAQLGQAARDGIERCLIEGHHGGGPGGKER